MASDARYQASFKRPMRPQADKDVGRFCVFAGGFMSALSHLELELEDLSLLRMSSPLESDTSLAACYELHMFQVGLFTFKQLGIDEHLPAGDA